MKMPAEFVAKLMSGEIKVNIRGTFYVASPEPVAAGDFVLDKNDGTWGAVSPCVGSVGPLCNVTSEGVTECAVPVERLIKMVEYKEG